MRHSLAAAFAGTLIIKSKIMSTANQFFKTCSAAGLLMLLSFTTALAIIRDTSLNAEIRREVQNGELNNKLYYPASVARFYAKNGYQAA